MWITDAQYIACVYSANWLSVSCMPAVSRLTMTPGTQQSSCFPLLSIQAEASTGWEYSLVMSSVGEKTLSKPWSAKFPTAPGSPKQNGGRPFAVTSNLMILNPQNWLTQDPRSSKIIPKQKKSDVFLQQPTWVPTSQLQLFPCTTAAWVAAHEPARGTCLIACEFKCDGSQNCI